MNQKTGELVLISLLNGFSTLNMVDVHDFGMVDVMEIITVSKLKKNVKPCVLNHPDKVY